MGKRYRWRGPVDLGGLAFRVRAARHRLGKRLEPVGYRWVGHPVDRVLWRLWNRSDGAPARWVSRRAVTHLLPEATRVHIPPRTLDRILKTPRRKDGVRRPSKSAFFWDGDWDRWTAPLTEHARVRFMYDVWAHRDRLRESESWRRFVEKMEAGEAYARTPQGLTLDTPENIEAFLRDAVALVESMAEHGYRDDLGDEELFVALDRDGRLIKVNVGRKRLAAAQLADVPSVPVRVAHVHADWWDEQRRRHEGTPEERLRAALEEWAATQAPGTGPERPGEGNPEEPA